MQTVIDVLQAAERPLRVHEIRERCAEHLGVPVNRSTVSHCLMRHRVGENRLFQRTDHGRYTWRST